MEKLSKEEIIQRDSTLLTGRALQIQRGAARAAVLGFNDGLVSVLCIVLATAAATSSANTVLIAGFAGLVAGAVSMAAGEWISVTSQVDLFKGVLADLKRLVKEDPEILADQVRDHFIESGFAPKTAALATSEIAENEDYLVTEYAQNVMGINPEELGSPWTAAFSSFLLFTAGAVLALCPWFFAGGASAIAASLIFSAIGGIVVGAYVGYSSGSSKAKGALRQLLIIAFASIVTYGVGYLFGVTVA